MNIFENRALGFAVASVFVVLMGSAFIFTESLQERMDIIMMVGIATTIVMLIRYAPKPSHFLESAATSYQLRMGERKETIPSHWASFELFRGMTTKSFERHAYGVIHERSTVIGWVHAQAWRFASEYRHTVNWNRLVIATTLTRHIPGWVAITVGRGKTLLMEARGERVELESKAFNDVLRVRASDPKLVYRLLDPVLMQMILERKAHPYVEFNGERCLVVLGERRQGTPEEELQFLDHVLDRVEANFRREELSSDLTVRQVTDLSRATSDADLKDRLRKIGMPTE